MQEYCASGALSPDYYQLMLSPCVADASTPIERLEQMDQLWIMDDMGLIHSIYDYERCMTLQSDVVDLDEAGIEIAPCNTSSLLQTFSYDEYEATLKLKGDRFSMYSVCF